MNDEPKSKEFPIPQALASGSWTSIELVLEGTPPNQPGLVRLEQTRHTALRLNRWARTERLLRFLSRFVGATSTYPMFLTQFGPGCSQ